MFTQWLDTSYNEHQVTTLSQKPVPSLPLAATLFSSHLEFGLLVFIHVTRRRKILYTDPHVQFTSLCGFSSIIFMVVYSSKVYNSHAHRSRPVLPVTAHFYQSAMMNTHSVSVYMCECARVLVKMCSTSARVWEEEGGMGV